MKLENKAVVSKSKTEMNVIYKKENEIYVTHWKTGMRDPSSEGTGL